MSRAFPISDLAYALKLYTSIHLFLFYRSVFIQGPANLVRDASCWQLEHEWRQDIAVVTKWLSGLSAVCYYL